MTLELVYTGDVVAIASGGLRRRVEYLNGWDLMLAVETEPLLGLRGGRLFVQGLGLERTGSPSANAGDIQTLDSIDAPGEWKLYEAWIQQEALDGRVSFLAGLYDVNREFDAIDTATLFLNSSFGIGKDFSQSGENGPSIFPATALALRIEARPFPHGYARVAVVDGVPENPASSRQGPDVFAVGAGDGVLCVGEVGYLVGEDEKSADRYTKIGLGGWFYSADTRRLGSSDWDEGRDARSRNFGSYLFGERTVYQESVSPQRGLAAFARVGFANSEVNAVGFFASAGVVYTGPIPGRPKDRLGVGMAAAVAGHDFERAARRSGLRTSRAEVAIEVSYRLEITPWLRLQPDLQYIVDPGFDPGVGSALAVGARVEIAY